MILPMLMVFIQGGDIRIILGVMIVFGITQLIDTYIFEPLVLGHQVNVHPIFIIVVAVLGEIVWGIPGLILSIPILGMVKIRSEEHTSELQSLMRISYAVFCLKKKNQQKR